MWLYKTICIDTCKFVTLTKKMTKTRLFLIYLFAISEFQMEKNALVRSNLKLERNDLRPTALFKTCYKASI